jgi:hypothetical protein
MHEARKCNPNALSPPSCTSLHDVSRAATFEQSELHTRELIKTTTTLRGCSKSACCRGEQEPRFAGDVVSSLDRYDSDPLLSL